MKDWRFSRVAPRCIEAPLENGQHLCYRVLSVAGSGLLTVTDIKCDVGAALFIFRTFARPRPNAVRP